MMLFKKALGLQIAKILLLVFTLLLQKRVFFLDDFNNLINIQIFLLIVSAVFDGGIVYRNRDTSFDVIMSFCAINYIIIALFVLTYFVLTDISSIFFWLVLIVLPRPLLKPVFQKLEIDSNISREYIIEYISFFMVIAYLLLKRENASVFELIGLQNVPFFLYFCYGLIAHKLRLDFKIYDSALLHYTFSNILMLFVLYVDYFYWLTTENEVHYLVIRGLMFQGMTSIMPVVHKVIYASKEYTRDKRNLYPILSMLFIGITMSWFFLSYIYLNAVGNSFNVSWSYLATFACILLIRLFVSIESIWTLRAGQHKERMMLSVVHTCLLALLFILSGKNLSNIHFLFLCSVILLITYFYFNNKYASS